MRRWLPIEAVCGLVVLCGAIFSGSPLAAQIQWDIRYTDADGTGFFDPTWGQYRRDSVAAATSYLNTVLDGRGTVRIILRTDTSTSALAYFGPDQVAITNRGSFQNGGIYQAARTNTRPFDGPNEVDGQGAFNFNYRWNYVNQPPSSNGYDMVTVAIHELLHGAGFLSFTDPQGRGLDRRTPPTPDIYAGYDRFLHRGSGSNATPLFNTNINDPNYGAFVGNPNVFTAGNDPNSGLFFIGPYSREVYGGAVPLYAPNPYRDGSSVSHVNDTGAIMYWSIGQNTVKRPLAYEIAMLLDIGWNVYDWNNTTGNWLDGARGDNLDVTQSRWRSSSGIIYINSTFYNTYSRPQAAPVLPPYAQVTSNIVLNFGGSGNTGYTATNDIGTIRLARLNLNSTATATSTIAGGTLLFGVNSDGTPSVLAPKIVQSGSGAFHISSDIVTTNTAGSGGWTGLTVEGSGSGRVTLSGVVSGSGGLTLSGSFILELTGTAANTFSGTTNVTSGTLLLRKSPTLNALGGNLTIRGGSVVLGADHQLPQTAIIRLEGGTFLTGEGTGHTDVVGTLQLAAASTIALGSGTHELTFSGISGTPQGTLTITGWSGSPYSSGTAGRILFANLGDNPNGQYSSFLANVRFAGLPGEGFFLATSVAGIYELVPTPEPAYVLLAAAGVLLAGGIFGRRTATADRAICPAV